MSQGEATKISESDRQVVLAELEQLLESSTFRASKRCRTFLQHVVERTITGRNDTLKERSIGVELFNLQPDFDSGQHTIVRVTANEVRKKLAQHYLAEVDAPHTVRIELPPGSYNAEFKWKRSLEKTASEDPLPKNVPVDVPPAIGRTLVPRRFTWQLAAVFIFTTAVAVFGAAFSAWQPAKAVAFAAKADGVEIPLAVASSPVSAVRMIMGSTSTFVDRSGRRWGPDRFFSSGSVRVRPSERIFRTLDPDIYRHARAGDFRYDIPLQPGSYELHLHFAETGLADFISAESSGEGQRLFRVSANGNRILDYYDVVADAAGPNIANQRVFRNISPAEDGFLHLSFESIRGSAMLSGIEVQPVSPGKVRPIRIRAGWLTSWQDATGNEWQGDSYFLGGNALVRRTNPVEDSNSITPSMALYTSERWGHFSYAVPVAEGRYRVNLKFSEGHYGERNQGVGGVGSRLFDVYCNGVALLRNFDIMKEAGGEGRPVERTFAGVRPSAQGKILLTFVPVKGMACLNGIEVVEE
jgi:hypothetical protein